MATYLITGANRGVGLEFVRQFSLDEKNIVVGLVRDKAAAEKKTAQLFSGRSNVHFVQAELADYNSLQAAFEQTSRITGGKLDYIIANAAVVSEWSAFNSIEELGEHPVDLEKDLLESFRVNVMGNVHLFNLFLPLVRKGNAKKVVTLSSGMADLDLINSYDIELAAPYAISKAAMNVAVAKFAAVGRAQGILFFSISPGLVETGHHADATEAQLQRVSEMGRKFAAYAPHFKGAITAEESVSAMRSVIYKASIEGGSSGSFVSHFGDKQWL